MEGTLGIKLPVGEVPAKDCMTVKKMTGLPLGEIKSRAAADECVFVCGYTDDDGLKLINAMRREMEKLGIAVRLYEDGVETPAVLFENLESLHAEIGRECGMDEFEG